MLALDVQKVELDPALPGFCRVRVQLDGGLVLDGLSVWPALHGPVVTFPASRGKGRPPCEPTPWLRSRIVQAVVRAWRGCPAGGAP